MSNKGERKKIKALNAPQSVHIHRKEAKWTVKTKAGAHKKDSSLSLGIALRNFTNLARQLNEAKTILLNGDVKVNGRIRKDYQFGIGLFDIVSIEKQKAFYRILKDKKGRVILKELKNDSNEKLSRVESKTVTNKGIQITTNDGLTITGTDAKVGDTLKLKVPENTVEELLPMESGAHIYITKGMHCSEQGKIIDIVPGTAKRKKLVKIEKDGKEYATTAKNVFVIGKGKVALDELK